MTIGLVRRRGHDRGHVGRAGAGSAGDAKPPHRVVEGVFQEHNYCIADAVVRHVENGMFPEPSR